MKDEISRIVNGPPPLGVFSYVGAGGAAMSESGPRSSEDYIPRTPPESAPASSGKGEATPANHKLRLWAALGGAALLVGGAGYLEFNSVLDTRHHHEALLAELQSGEDQLFATYTQQGSINTAASAMVLHAGVKLRSTPGSVDSKLNQRIIPGNLVEKIPEGQEVLVTAAIWKVDKNGTWLGFTFDRPGAVTGSKKTVKPTDVAQNYVWFNYGQIADETNKDGQPFVSERRFAHTSDKLATESAQMDAAGNVTETSAGAPAAYGVHIQADKLQKIFNMLHITSTPSAPQATPNK